MSRKKACRTAAAPQGLLPQPRALVDELGPLVGLAAEEERAADDGEDQHAQRLLAVAQPGRGDRRPHRHAGRDEDEGHERDERDAEDLGLPRPGRRDRMPQEGVAAEQARRTAGRR